MVVVLDYMYVKKIITLNKEGGVSNKNLGNIISSNLEILKILRKNSIKSNFTLICLKLLFKFSQRFFLRISYWLKKTD